MRKNLLLSALAIGFCSLALTSCDLDKSKTTATPWTKEITWTGADVTIEVPAVSDLAAHAVMGTGSFTYDLDSFLRKQTGDFVGLANIDEMRFSSCKITVNNPDATNNLQNFEMAQASFNSNANATLVTFCQINDNPNNYATELNLPITNTENMKSYFPSSGPVTINYNLGGKLRNATTKTLSLTAHIEYKIHLTK